jgi:hypothetical protein
MRSLLCAALFLVACGSSPTTGGDGGGGGGDGGGDGGATYANCTRTCPTCTGGTVCFTSTSAMGFRSFCARPCGVTSDCPPAERCTDIFGAAPGSTRVCVSQSNPMICEGAFADPKFHCDFPPATCMGSILLKGFSQPANLLCGTEHEFCPGGCDPSTTGGDATCKQ